MTDQKQPGQGNQQQGSSRQEHEITQNRPSHMNQGKEGFRPDFQKRKDEHSENQK